MVKVTGRAEACGPGTQQSTPPTLVEREPESDWNREGKREEWLVGYYSTTAVQYVVGLLLASFSTVQYGTAYVDTVLYDRAS